MKLVRLLYLLYVVALACAHMFITLSPWTAPAYAAGGVATVGETWFVALFAAWIIAALADLAMVVQGMLPLTFAGEAILSNASLVVLLVLDAGVPYFLCAVIPPTLVLVKAVEEIGHTNKVLKHL